MADELLATSEEEEGLLRSPIISPGDEDNDESAGGTSLTSV